MSIIYSKEISDHKHIVVSGSGTLSNIRFQLILLGGWLDMEEGGGRSLGSLSNIWVKWSIKVKFSREDLEKKFLNSVL